MRSPARCNSATIRFRFDRSISVEPTRLMVARSVPLKSKIGTAILPMPTLNSLNSTAYPWRVISLMQFQSSSFLVMVYWVKACKSLFSINFFCSWGTCVQSKACQMQRRAEEGWWRSWAHRHRDSGEGPLSPGYRCRCRN